MFTSRTDLPLDRDALGRFLPWIMGFMTYLSVLALSGMLALNGLVARWETGMNATLTVQLPPSADAEADTRHLEDVIAVLSGLPEVRKAEPLSEGRVAALLAPWLGREAVIGDLPLPRLVDVELKDGLRPDMTVLRDRLERAAPGAVVDDHLVWLERLVGLIRSAQTLAGAVLLLIGLATIGTIVFTTRTALAIHQDVVEVLHLIGAQDTYVARQFSTRALVLGLKGGALGIGLALPTLWGLARFAGRLEGSMLPDLALGPWDWTALALLPAAVALIAATTARVTVLRALRRML